MIIPVLHDWEELRVTLRALGDDPRVEIIVVNGGAAPAAADRPPRLVQSAAGRGCQMNAGAAEARGSWLLFLHADTRLPGNWVDEVQEAGREPRVVGGSFALGIDASSVAARVIERGAAARVRWFGLPYGDQALFVRTDVFNAMGGFRPLALMEDVDFARRLQRMGHLHHSRSAVLTSARRWHRDGWLRRTIGNIALVTLYFLGVAPERLAPFYRRTSRSRSARVALGVLARAPSEQGKTRLLAAVRGADGYQLRKALLLDTLELSATVRDVERAVIYSPASAGEETRELSGPAFLSLPQRGATLGERMRNAFDDLFALGHDAVILIGSDTPNLPATLIEEATMALRAGPDCVVLGPATDGGYYLIGLCRRHPELFEGVKWSTDEVLEETVRIARRLHLPVRLLPEWFDVDTVDDLRRISSGHTKDTDAWAAARLNP